MGIDFGRLKERSQMERLPFNPEVAPSRRPLPYFAAKPLPALRPYANQRIHNLIVAVGAGVIVAVAAVILLIFLSFATLKHAHARDDGRYANEPLHQWFDQLASGKGLCCSFADGFSVQDVDWDTQDGRYRVHLRGEWIVVPENALVTEPNRFGPAVVWPYQDAEGVTQIRCFLPGAGA